LCSFALEIKDLPKDLLLSSSSIYFSIHNERDFKTAFSPNVWLKWPNDLYLNNNKIGGTITKKIGETLICGHGGKFKKRF